MPDFLMPPLAYFTWPSEKVIHPTIGIIYAISGIIYTTIGVIYVTIGMIYTSISMIYTTIGIIYATLSIICFTSIVTLIKTLRKYATIGVYYTEKSFATLATVILKLFTAVINSVPYYAQVIVTGSHFHPSLILAGKARSRP